MDFSVPSLPVGAGPAGWVRAGELPALPERIAQGAACVKSKASLMDPSADGLIATVKLLRHFSRQGFWSVFLESLVLPPYSPITLMMTRFDRCPSNSA
jgi:hypothetical protein